MTRYDKQYADFNLNQESIEALKILADIGNSADQPLATYTTKTRLDGDSGKVTDAEEIKHA